jgi:hypothetical protein
MQQIRRRNTRPLPQERPYTIYSRLNRSAPLSLTRRNAHAEGMAEEASVNGGSTGGAGADDTNSEGDKPRHRVRLPHFIVPEPVGAGQVVKRITTAVGVKPCAPCARRAARLDRWLRIEPRR